jgi:hypothetical protein
MEIKKLSNPSLLGFGVFCCPGHDTIAKQKTSQLPVLCLSPKLNKDGYYWVSPSNIKNGDRVTMTLDLSSRVEYSGTLSMSMNSQPSILLYDDMLYKLASFNYQGFVPAARYLASSITIVSIKEF